MNLIVISISAVLIAVILGVAAIIVAMLKYRESAELGAMKAEIETFRTELKRADTKDVKERLGALENRAGIRMF